MSQAAVNLKKTDPQSKKKKKLKLSMPHSYVFMGLIILLAAVMTYIVPAGEFDRVEDVETGKMLVVPDSYHAVERTPVGILEIFMSMHKGMVQSSEIIFYVFFAYGFVFMLTKTGAFNSGIGAVIRKIKGRETFFIPIFMTIFGLMGASFGMYEESYGYIPLLMGITVALGFDAFVGLAIVYVAIATGFSAAFTNPFTIGIAQSIAQVPLYSGIGLRLIAFVCFMSLSIFYVMRYARKVKQDPEKSLVKDVSFPFLSEVNHKEITESVFTVRHKISLLLFVATIGTIVVGTVKLGWYLSELSGVMIMMMIVIGLINRVSLGQVSEIFIEACKNVVFGALIIGMAKAILVILEDGHIIDTIVYYMSSSVAHLSPYVAASSMVVVQMLLNFFISSGSAQAATSMPIMVPLSDLLEIKRQVAVLAFQFGDGFASMIWPHTVAVVCGIAGIPVDRWYKFLWPLFLAILALQIIFVVIAVAINYGP